MNVHSQHGAFKRPITDEDLDLYERFYCAEAREDFYAYRRYLNPKLAVGWYQQDVAQNLQRFYADWYAGKKPVLILASPPQHGKSTQLTDFISWASGKNPELRTIYTSYADNLGTVANQRLQRIFASDKFARVFPDMGAVWRMPVGTKPSRNTYHLEFGEGKGEFRNTTVRGQITGLGLDLGVIDDPLKGREEARSLPIRNKTWEWFTDDFFSRFSENAALVMIMTRWHLDDPVGRFMEMYPNAHLLSYPAFGRFRNGKWTEEEDEKKALPLFPELKSKEFLLKRKKLLSQGSWKSLYQQNPIAVGGGMFPVAMFRSVVSVPRKDIVKSVRYWDKAGTQDGGAYTAGVLMHLMADETFLVEDVRHGQWGALEREKRIKQTAATDEAMCPNLEIYVEQEPGSGGKESAERSVRMLAGHSAYADRVTGDKEVRADPYAAQVQGGNVALVAGEWNADYLDEHEDFPAGRRKDQVDASSGAFNKLAEGSTYDITMRWVG